MARPSVLTSWARPSVLPSRRSPDSIGDRAGHLFRQLPWRTARAMFNPDPAASPFPLPHATGHDPRIVLKTQFHVGVRRAGCHALERRAGGTRNLTAVARIASLRAKRRKIHIDHPRPIRIQCWPRPMRKQHARNGQGNTNRQTKSLCHDPIESHDEPQPVRGRLSWYPESARIPAAPDGHASPRGRRPEI